MTSDPLHQDFTVPSGCVSFPVDMVIEPTPRNAAHLLRRAAWGGTPDEIEACVAVGIEATVDRLLDPSGAPEMREPVIGPGFLPYDFEVLVGSHLRHCATSPTPAIERLQWFWQGHFATSIEKIEFPDLMLRQWATQRRLGLGRFDDLLMAMVHDPALNLYLDLHASVLGRPNENFSREVMELFSMGAGRGYTQRDVVEGGRALTGYSLVEHPRIARPIGSRLVPTLHDDGPKTFLGRSGRLDATDVIAAITDSEECHRFVPERLWFRYAGTDIPAEVSDQLSRSFGADLRIDRLLRAMLTHPRFYEADVRGGLVASPFELVVRTVRGFGLPLPDATTLPVDELEEQIEENGWWWAYGLFEGLGLLGQVPGIPPNVAGWPHNAEWLDSNRAAARLQLGTELGGLIAEADLPVAEALRSAVGTGGDRLTRTLLARFGVVEWSAETGSAIERTAAGTDPVPAVAAAFAVAFTSPEVTLS